jgi:hypothetical protein
LGLRGKRLEVVSRLGEARFPNQADYRR